MLLIIQSFKQADHAVGLRAGTGMRLYAEAGGEGRAPGLQRRSAAQIAVDRLNKDWPFSMDRGEGVPGMPCVDGVGGAERRIKLEKASTSLKISAPNAGKLVVSSGVGLKRQGGGSMRSSGKSSLVTPNSTL